VQADLARAGEVRSQMTRYTAGQRAEGLEAQATARRMGGRAVLTGSRLAAMGTIIGGFGSAAADFGTFQTTFGRGAPTTEPAAGSFMPATAPARTGILRSIFGGR
jgi:hypothetical protein